MKRPCTCDKAQCRLCVLYHQNPAYQALWSEDQSGGPVASAWPPPGKKVKRPVPCNALGMVLARRECNCQRDVVYACGHGHGKVTQNGWCEHCPDYQAEES